MTDESIPSPYQLGVLMVHGIGRQRQAETLVLWGDALARTLEEATRQRVSASVESATIADDGAEAVLLIRVGELTERWLLMEAWWAEMFLAPTYGQLVTWSLKALPWAIASHLYQQVSRRSHEMRPAVRLYNAASACALLVAAIALSPLVALALLVSLVVGLLPIPRLRAAILAMQGTLAETIGDSLAFLESPIRAGFIRTTVLGRIERLKRRSRKTLVLAHSQGAAVVVDALGGMLDPDPTLRFSPERQPPVHQDAMPDTLFTFGAGTNQLAALRSLRVRPLMFDPRGSVQVAVGLSFAFAAFALWLYLGNATPRETLQAVVLSAASFGLLIGSIYAVAAVYRRLDWLPNDQTHQPDESQTGWLGRRAGRWIATLAVLWIVSVAPVLGYSWQADLPGIPAYLAVGTFLLLVFVIASTFGRWVMWDVSVRTPPGLRRWVDMYASADPVPNGPTRTVPAWDDADTAAVESTQVWNLGSILKDHTSYWSNREAFVLRVLRVCAESAESVWRSLLPDTGAALEQRAAWRVAWLRAGRAATTSAWAAAGVATWLGRRSDLAELPRIPQWRNPVIDGVIDAANVAAATIACAWISGAVLTALWRRWMEREQRQAFTSLAVGGTEWIWLPLLTWFVTLSAGFALLVLFWGPLGAVERVRGDEILHLAASLVLAVVTAAVLVRVHPPPKDARLHWQG